MSFGEKGEVRLKNTRSDEFGVRGSPLAWVHQSDLTRATQDFLCVLKVLAAQSQKRDVANCLKLNGVDFFETAAKDS